MRARVVAGKIVGIRINDGVSWRHPHPTIGIPMRPSIVVYLLGALAFSATQLKAQYSNLQTTLANLPPGTQYQIIFVTDDSTTATDGKIADYNSFVRADVPNALTSFLAGYGGPPASWNAVVSTSKVNANSNAPSSGLVFNTNGIEVASPAASLYSGSLLSPVGYFPSNVAVTIPPWVWTGSFRDGEVGSPYGMGQEQPGELGLSVFGEATLSSQSWIALGVAVQTPDYYLYALSTPITTVPEPASFVLLALASLGLLLRCRR
jgi:hypothetical protein